MVKSNGQDASVTNNLDSQTKCGSKCPVVTHGVPSPMYSTEFMVNVNMLTPVDINSLHSLRVIYSVTTSCRKFDKCVTIYVIDKDRWLGDY